MNRTVQLCLIRLYIRIYDPVVLEDHRIVPQSELVVADGNHFMLFERPQVIAQPVESFLQRARHDLEAASTLVVKRSD